MEVDQFHVNGYFEIEREKLNLIKSISKTLVQLKNYKNETIHFEQQRMINQVRQQVFQQALQGAPKDSSPSIVAAPYAKIYPFLIHLPRATCDF